MAASGNAVPAVIWALTVLGAASCATDEGVDHTLEICTEYCRQVNTCAGIEGEEFEEEMKDCPPSCADGIRAEEDANGAACGAAARELWACMAALPCDDLLGQQAGCSAEITEYEETCGADDGDPDQ